LQLNASTITFDSLARIRNRNSEDTSSNVADGWLRRVQLVKVNAVVGFDDFVYQTFALTELVSSYIGSEYNNT